MNENCCVLYNPLSSSGNGEMLAKKLSEILPDSNIRYVDITSFSDYKTFFDFLPRGEKLIIAGGDGTLNRFVNEAELFIGGMKLYYYPCGTGNDFIRDIEKADAKEPVEISEAIKNLPVIKVNGLTKKFLNGIGYGIDGYCSETGEKRREKSSRPVNYTMIAIKGMLFGYNPTCADVTVDGKKYSFKDVWLAPSMNGRFFGGGMMPTPLQKRSSDTLSCMVWHGKNRLKTLMLFPKIFKGEHVKNEKAVSIMTGKSITVSFDRPVALQIDGEVVPDVTSYTVNASTPF